MTNKISFDANENSCCTNLIPFIQIVWSDYNSIGINENIQFKYFLKNCHGYNKLKNCHGYNKLKNFHGYNKFMFSLTVNLHINYIQIKRNIKKHIQYK